MKILKVEKGQCSFYENVKSKRNVEMTLAEFVNNIRSNRWRTQVERFRQLKAEGKVGEAQTIKDRMPGLVVAGICDGGHAKTNIRTLSGNLMIDIDDYMGDPKDLIRELERLPWVRAAWVSISGAGVKAVVQVDARTQEEYEKQAYPIVARHIAALLDTPVDMQCRDLSRTCYASYDPDAFYREACEVYPWREEYAEEMARKAQEVEQEPPGGKLATRNGANQSTATGMVAFFLENFIRNNPYVNGHRHRFLLKLGRDARYAKMSVEELERLLTLSAEQLEMPDCGAAEIKRNITDGYYFNEKNPSADYMQARVKGHWGHPDSKIDLQQLREEEEDVLEHNLETSRSAPCLPDWIFEHLNPLFTEGLQVAHHPRQRDMLFLSMLTNLSGCMPNVKMLYGEDCLYTHLYTCVISSSASGKGIMSTAKGLSACIQNMFNKENEKAMLKYEEELLEWECEVGRAKKAGRKPDMNLRPTAVNRKVLVIPADTSRTQLIQLMCDSPNGLLMNVSEMDTLRTALNTEYGKFDDLFRACFHHESFGTDFKSDKRQYFVDCSKLALCASGTPDQFRRLCPSLENGAYSRYLIYLGEHEMKFRLMAPDSSRRTKSDIFRSLGYRVLRMYHHLQANETEVRLSARQWEQHQAYFDRMLERVRLENLPGLESVVLRAGIHVARIAMILTVLHKNDANWEFKEIECSDEDFQIAMAIVDVLLKHSMMFSTTLSSRKMPAERMKNFDELLQALESLPGSFLYTQLIEALMKFGFTHSTSRRIRKRLLVAEVIIQEEDRYRINTAKLNDIIRKGFL